MAIRYHDSARTMTQGAPFTAVVEDDHYVYVSGIVAADIPGHESVLGDVSAETTLVMETIAQILGDLGLDMGRIVRVDLHMADFEEFPAANQAYAKFFPEGNFPARTSTQSTRLFGGSRVEVTCIVRRTG